MSVERYCLTETMRSLRDLQELSERGLAAQMEIAGMCKSWDLEIHLIWERETWHTVETHDVTNIWEQ
eukprot:3933476-Amphidinium_carterae.1